MNTPTLGLCIITKEYGSSNPELHKRVIELIPYFDQIYIQINGPHRDGAKEIPGVSKVHFSGFEWVDDFAAARNALLERVETDYWMWIDTDDTIEGLENLRAVVAEMEAGGIDRMMATYKYAQNELGEEIAPHVRERIMRTAHPYYWFGRIHETITSDRRDEVGYTDQFAVVQHKTQEEFEASTKRNHAILMDEYAKTPRDPRITYYLALSLFSQKQWVKAIELFVEHIRTSGSHSDQYDSWLKIAECHSKVASLDKGISAALEATKLLPARPTAYFVLAQLYFDLEDYARCVEWIKTGMQKPELKTLAIADPTLRYRTIMLGALAELQRGKVDDAWQLINSVLEQSPDYPLAQKYYPMFKQAYLEKQAIDHAKWLMGYLQEEGQPGKVLEALPTRMAFDPRLTKERSKIYPPQAWAAKSIVFYCGAAGEPWGPDRLEDGIGGSEEAVVYLTAALARLGWSVTVYCDREDQIIAEADDDGHQVEWLPWYVFNPKDAFDVIVAWRNPKFFTDFDIKARVKAVDLHDTPLGPQEITEDDVASTTRFFFKSQVQREMAAAVPERQASVISNGIVAKQFEPNEHPVESKRGHSVGYFSSYDRGLLTLLEMWPRIRKAVPDATLDIYYGWQSFDAVHRSNPQMMQWKWGVMKRIQSLKDDGVAEHGRVSHEVLAQEMMHTKVWAYPTEFSEINCITALKAQAAGMIPVTTHCYALKETVLVDEPEVLDIATNDKARSEFARRVILALQSKDEPDGAEVIKRFDWLEIALKWNEALHD